MERAERICQYLKDRGVEVSFEEVVREADGASIVRPHFASLLVKKGYVSSKKEAFYRYLETHRFHQETDGGLPLPEEAIERIHQCGGKAVLAHPGSLKLGRSGQEALIRELHNAGLDGLEVYYSGHTYAEKKWYEKLAMEYQMIQTAGSDYHGEKVKPNVKLVVKRNSYEY